MEREKSTNTKLKALAADEEPLNALEREHGKFNLFRVLRVDELEIRHSNVLAWFLDPRQNHQLRNLFLRGFLDEVLRIAKEDLGWDVQVPDLDWNAADEWQVGREKESRDIQLTCEKLKLVVCIENKWNAKENCGGQGKDGQLKRYADRIEDCYSGWSKLLIYLTLNGDLPSRKKWIPVSYKTVLKVLGAARKRGAKTIQKPQKQFIDQYIKVLQRKLGMNCREYEIASKIYRKHPAAIQWIVQHFGSMVQDHVFPELEAELPKSIPGLKLGKHTASYIQFNPRFPPKLS